MRAEIFAVGSELLLGDVDTNSAWISARLAEIGVDVFRHTTVGDNVDRMVAVLAEAAGRADAIVVTGGLGPTQDDLTRVAVARLAGVELVRDDALVEDIRAHFARSGREMPLSNLGQADFPEGAQILQRVGTAPGFGLTIRRSNPLPEVEGDVVIYCVPGVPREMETMVARDVVPGLAARAGLATTVSRVVRTSGVSESAVAEDCAAILDRLEAAGNPTLAFLATRGETRVRVTGKAGSRHAALVLVDPVVDEVVALLGSAVVGVDDEGAEHAVARQLLAAGWTLGVAESISAGGLGARLVTVLGASDWFRGGFIVYATELKSILAGVQRDLLERHGPVSEEVAGALARGTAERTGATVGLAVVGVAGPTMQNDQPVGTVCVGAALPDGSAPTRTVRLPGRERAELQEWSVSVALDFLRRRLAALA